MASVQWVLIRYWARENGARSVQSVELFDSPQTARETKEREVAEFREKTKEKYLLKDNETGPLAQIDFRGGLNEWYTWEIKELENGVWKTKFWEEDAS